MASLRRHHITYSNNETYRYIEIRNYNISLYMINTQRLLKTTIEILLIGGEINHHLSHSQLRGQYQFSSNVLWSGTLTNGLIESINKIHSASLRGGKKQIMVGCNNNADDNNQVSSSSYYIRKC